MVGQRGHAFLNRGKNKMRNSRDNNDALPAVLIALLAAWLIAQTNIYVRRIYADRMLIATQTEQLANLRTMLQIATDPVDVRQVDGRRLRK